MVRFLSVFAFETSPFPLCISLENHCDFKQQKMIQNYLLDYFGQNIFVPLEYQIRNKKFCTLEDLKYKIFIQTRGDNDFELDPNDVSTDTQTPTKAPSSPRKKKASDEKTKRMLDPFLQSIVGLITAQKMSLADGPFSINSVSELKFSKEAKQDVNLLKQYSYDHFIRVYPQALRIQSSNFEPVQKWDLGVQMCAMNYQTYDRGMAMNKAMFRQNGGIGYLLKPYLNEPNIKSKGLSLKISILGSQEIEHMTNKKFVLMFSVTGSQEDSLKNKPKYIEPKNIDRSSVHAIYGLNRTNEVDEKEEVEVQSENGTATKTFVTIQHSNVIVFLLTRPKTAMLEVSCRQRGALSDTSITSTFIPLTAMRSGLRVIQLMNSKLGYMHDCLILAKFEFSFY